MDPANRAVTFIIFAATLTKGEYLNSTPTTVPEGKEFSIKRRRLWDWARRVHERYWPWLHA